MTTRRFHRTINRASVVVWILFALAAAILLCLLVGCGTTDGLEPTGSLYGPGGYAERNHVRRTPYFPAPCRVRR